MGTITNGSVTYERRVKTGDYEHKQASVTVHYTLDGEPIEAANELIGLAGQLATGHVFGMLRTKPSDVLAADPPRNEPAPVEQLPASTPSADITNVVYVVPDDAGVVVEADPPMNDPAGVSAEAKEKRRRATKAEMEARRAQSDTSSSDGPVVDDFTAAPTLTDAELRQALSRKQQQLKGNKSPIEALLGQFVASEESFTKIPYVRRVEFVEKLNALV